MSLDWRQHASCKTAPDLFFQETGRPSQKLSSVCQGCPVLIACTFDALRRNDGGFQAGMSKAERDRIHRWDRSQRTRLEVAS